MLYFAYGSNLDIRVMRAKGVGFLSRRAARLVDFELRFDKQAFRPGMPATVGYANIAPRPGKWVEGAVYTLAESALPPLDRSERHPQHYGRMDVTIVVERATHAAFAYRAQANKTAPGLCPSRDYLDRLLAGGDVFSPEYRERLQSVATFQATCMACTTLAEIRFERTGESVRSRCIACGAIDVT